MDLIIGSHVSYKNDTGLLGSIKEALSYGANTFMFYTGAPQNTLRSRYTICSIQLQSYSRLFFVQKYIKNPRFFTPAE